jgi:heme exporter protein B
MQIRTSTWATKSAWLLAKELKSEFRTRFALNAVFMFALTTLAVTSFSIGAFAQTPPVVSSLLWLVIFFSSSSGLAQIFVKEEEARTANLLRLVAAPDTVFLGKLLFNLALLSMLELIVVPLFIVWMNVSVLNLWLFLCTLLLGTLGLVCATTIIAAIVSKARAKGSLFAVLSFPILLPLLIASIDGTRLSMEGRDFAAGGEDLRLLVSYLVVMFVASFLLFDSVWSE